MQFAWKDPIEFYAPAAYPKRSFWSAATTT